MSSPAVRLARAALALGLALHAALSLRATAPAVAAASATVSARVGAPRDRGYLEMLDRIAGMTPEHSVFVYWAKGREGGRTRFRYCSTSYELFPRPVFLAYPGARTSSIDEHLEVPAAPAEQQALLDSLGIDYVLVDGVAPGDAPWKDQTDLVWFDREQDRYLVPRHR